MASFTDKAPQFNPYVAQKPVEAMVKVGMQKQQQYDQGYAKIQDSIDKVAGMDIARDVDKQYLQGKLNQLGDSLKGVAAGDFSNFQLTNSVAGMAGKITNDENVQNAVSSTYKYKTGLEEMKTANKAGKGSPSNDFDFNTQVNKWYNGEMEDTFSGGYTQYTDYKKNALALVKELTGYSTLTEDAFRTDSKGNLVLADAIIRTKLGGIDPKQIQTALRAGMTAADKNQMRIDGRYNYSGTSEEDLIEGISAGFKQQETHYNKQKKMLIAALSTTTSVPEQTMLQDKIDAIDLSLEGIGEEYESIASMVPKDPEQAKGLLETVNFMNNFSKAFSYTEYSQTHEKSPEADMALRREVKDQNWKLSVLKMQQDALFHIDDMELKQDANDIARIKANAATGGTPIRGGFPGLNNVGESAPTSHNFEKTTVSDYETLERKKMDFLDGMGLAYDTEEEQILANEWIATQRSAYLKGPKDVDAEIVDYFEATIDETRVSESNQQSVMEIQARADKKFGNLYKKIPEEASVFQIGTENGIDTITPIEMVNFNQKKNKYISTSSAYQGSGSWGTGSNISIEYDSKLAKEELSPKEYEMFEIMRKQEKGFAISENDKEIADQVRLIHDEVNTPYRKELDSRTKFKDAETKKILMVSQPKGYKIITDKKVNRDDVANIFTNMNLIAAQPGGIAGFKGKWEADKASSLSIDPNMVATLGVADKTEYGPERYLLTVTGKDGTISVPMTPEQYDHVYDGRFDSSPRKQRLQKYNRQMKKRGGFTTSSDSDPITGKDGGPTNVGNSFLNSTDFPRSGKIGISGNIKRSRNTGKVLLRLNLYDARKGKWRQDIAFPSNEYFSDSELDGIMSILTDKRIYEILYGEVPTGADLKELYTEINKPKS